jgi:hypothetical protein
VSSSVLVVLISGLSRVVMLMLLQPRLLAASAT